MSTLISDKRLVGGQAHICDGALDSRASWRDRRWRPDPAPADDRQHVLGAGAPGHHGFQAGGIDHQGSVIGRTFVGGQGLPIGQSGFQGSGLRGAGLAHDVLKGDLVGGDQTGARTSFDGHVADRHAAFHGQRTNSLTGIFDHIAGAAGGADLADDGQHHILGANAFGQLAVNPDQHGLGRLLHQGLGRQNMFDFRGADAKSQRAESAMGRGMGIAANDGGAGQGEALFGPDDMHDALTNVVHGQIFDAEVSRVLFQGFDLDARLFVLDALGTVGGGNVMVGHGQSGLGVADLAAGGAQTFERLRAGHFMDQMAVDIDQTGAVILDIHKMAVPDLFEQGARFGHGVLRCSTLRVSERRI